MIKLKCIYGMSDGKTLLPAIRPGEINGDNLLASIT